MEAYNVHSVLLLHGATIHDHMLITQSKEGDQILLPVCSQWSYYSLWTALLQGFVDVTSGSSSPWSRTDSTQYMQSCLSSMFALQAFD